MSREIELSGALDTVSSVAEDLRNMPVFAPIPVVEDLPPAKRAIEIDHAFRLFETRILKLIAKPRSADTFKRNLLKLEKTVMRGD